MSIDTQRFKEHQKSLIYQDKKRLGILKDSQTQNVNDEDEHQCTHAEKEVHYLEDKSEEKENSLNSQQSCTISSPAHSKQNAPLVERLNLSCNEPSVEKEKQAFIDKLINSENPLTFRSDDTVKSTMLRYGEYSPNNPLLRVAAAPYLGVGEYEQRRHLLLRERQNDYKQHINKTNEQIKDSAKNFFLDSKPVSTAQNKCVQTDIQNINHKLVQYESNSNNLEVKDISPESANSSNKENCCVYNNNNNTNNNNSNNLSSNKQRIDQRLTSFQNGLLQSEMDKPRSILSNRRTESPRERLLSDLQYAYQPTYLDGFSYQDRTDVLHQERLKHEAYQRELDMQIEEKRRINEMRDEHERREQERENRRYEQQILRMHEEQMREEQRRTRRDDQEARRNSEEYLKRKQELLMKPNYRKHLESESSTLSLRNTNVASKLSHYSPPVSRRNHCSYNVPSSSYSDPSSRSPPCKKI